MKTYTNKINIQTFQKDKVDLSKYFIQPYYDETTLRYLVIQKDKITWYNNNLKKCVGNRKINNSIKKMYHNSRFNGYNIVVIGYLNQLKDDYRTFAVLDLLLYDEFTGKNQSKKYSIRYDNIVQRFVDSSKKNELVYAIFSYKYQENIFKGLLNGYIKSGTWRGFNLYKDNPYNYDEDEMYSIKLVETKNGICVATKIDKFKDEEGKEQDGLISITVQNDKNELIEISKGISSSQRIKFKDDIDLILRKNILYFQSKIDENYFYTFINVE